MKYIYDADGNKYNSELFSTMFWKTLFASFSCTSDFATPNSYRWGEEVSGGTTTPFVDMRAVYNTTPHQADCRIITYEDSSPIVENGKVYFTASSQRGGGSGGAIVFALDIGTCQIEMTGCILAFYNGSGFSATGNAIMYNRNTGKWQLMTHSGDTQGHDLLIAESISDPRYGVTNAYYEPMDYESPGSGDEDQFVFYSDELEKWVMIYVSIRNNNANYILKVQTSDYPDHGFTFYNEINDSSRLRATGVVSTKVGGKRYILSGSSATGMNKNLIYTFPELEYVGEVNLDIGTNAIYGTWPMLFPICDGTRTRYYFFTFDRTALITSNQWSYGCLYMYCAQETNEGLEFDIKRDGLTIHAPVTETYNISDLHFKRKWALREPMNSEIKLSEIRLGQAIFNDQSNMYPVIGTSVAQTTDGLYLASVGSTIIVGGEHNLYSAYVLNNEWIQGTDKRAVVLVDNNNTVKMRVSVTKDGKVYGYNGTDETLLGTMRENSKELIVCVQATWVNVFEH